MRESGLVRCLDIETTDRRVSTLSNYEGTAFHAPTITAGAESDSESGTSEETAPEESGNFLMAAVNKARRSMFAARKSIFKANEKPP